MLDVIYFEIRASLELKKRAKFFRCCSRWTMKRFIALFARRRQLFPVFITIILVSPFTHFLVP